MNLVRNYLLLTAIVLISFAFILNQSLNQSDIVSKSANQINKESILVKSGNNAIISETKSEIINKKWNDLTVTLSPTNLTLASEQNTKALKLYCEGIYRGDNKIFNSSEFLNMDSLNNKITFYYNNFNIEYLDEENGFRQNFLVKKRPEGNGNLTVYMQVDDEYCLSKKEDNINIQSAEINNPGFNYSGLHVIDANNEVLPSEMQIAYHNDEQYIVLVINDANAEYPVLIDPVFTTLLEIDTVLNGSQIYNYYGDCVSNAGDVNGDGFDDILIGSPKFDNAFENAGKAELFYGNENGISGTPAWTMEGDSVFEQIGNSVSNAGDLNGDGFDDVIIGCENLSYGQSVEGGAFIYYGSASGLSATPDYVLERNQVAGNFAQSVSAAGDINNDNYDDVVIGSINYNNGTNRGAAWVYYGSATGVSNGNFTHLYSTGLKYGESVSGAGDVNNDSYDDIIVGQADYNSGSYTAVGRVLVYHGSAAGITTTAAWTKSYNDSQKYSHLGTSVSNAGDVNNDGFDDVICGAPNYRTDVPTGYKGRAYVFLGSPTGLSTTANKTFTGTSSSYLGKSVSDAGDVNGDGFDDIIYGVPEYDNIYSNEEGAFFIYAGSATGISNTIIYSKIGTQTSGQLGQYVSGNCDINNDGFADVICSSPRFDLTYIDQGFVNVVYGRSGAFTSIPGNWHYESNLNDSHIGYGLATGDINGDGKSDLIAGGLNDGILGSNGSANIFYGTSTGLPAAPNFQTSGVSNENLGVNSNIGGDVNGDGFDEVLVPAYNYSDGGYAGGGQIIVYYGSISGVSLANKWTYDGNAASLYLGTPASCAGDVNGDGYDDILVSAYGYSNGEAGEGAVYCFYGSSTGLPASPNIILEGNQSNAGFGTATSGAGDLNGDGYDDIAIAAINYDNGSVDEGAVFIYLGSPTGLHSTPDKMLEINTSYAQFGAQISNGGDINMDGYSDLLVGSKYYDSNHGRADIYYGKPTGIAATPDWTYLGEIFGGFFGTAVEIVGDVNDDNYNDVAISQSGNVYLFYGNGIGLINTYNELYFNPFIDNNSFGWDISRGGDINIDGIDDLVVSCPSFSNIDTAEGGLFAYYGFAGGCDAPISIAVDSVNAYEVFLSWPAEASAMKYIYRMKKVTDTVWSYGDTDSLHVAFNSLTLSTDYEFQLQYFCSDGASNWTSVLFSTLSTFDCDDLSITGVTVNTADNYDFTLNWDPIYLDVTYLIRYKLLASPTWTYQSSSINSISLTTFDTCQSYTCEVAVLCTGDTSAFTSVGTIVVNCPPCFFIPTAVNATNITNSGAKIIWNAVAGASSYRVKYRKLGTAAWKTKLCFTTSLKLKSLLPNTTYEYAVQTVCGIYSSAYSPINTFTTLPLKSGISEPEFYVYPNPTHGNVTISAAGLEPGIYALGIVNLFGETIYIEHIVITETGELNATLKPDKLMQGVYIIHLNGNNFEAKSKLVVQ